MFNHSSSSAVTLTNLTFEWPDGQTAIDNISGTFDTGKTGLVGRNGTGKSTLLKLISGELNPTRGKIDRHGDVAYLPQTLTLNKDTSIADLLGIAHTLQALRAIEAGDVSVENFDIVGDDWDIETRADQQLHDLGFSSSDLNRTVHTLSGGEAILVALTGLRLRATPITLLDEPTNNLDRRTRAALTALVETWPGTLIVVSHDRELLDRMNQTVELYAGAMTTFGGTYSEWEDYQAAEQAAAEQAVTQAKSALKARKEAANRSRNETSAPRSPRKKSRKIYATNSCGRAQT
ncbi:ATP-binding cassette domain-containing protein [Timonella sp. A28]|uniref:ATP-binding cassette domain-containing protein n=1 Tax=Timonella sp. A28 TaxID=3442640 RepID=UPI003EBFA4BD